MATGDIISAEIGDAATDRTGFIDITFEGLAFTLGDTTHANRDSKYHKGNLDDDTVNSNLQVTVVDLGFTGGVADLKTRVLKGTDTFRNPYPDDLVIHERAIGNDLLVRFSLSQSVYEKSQAGAGNSGTNPILNAAAGLVSGTGYSSNAIANFECVNNSSRQYPNVIGQWDWDVLKGGWRAVTESFPVGFRAVHGNGMDGVRLSVTGSDSGTIIESFRSVTKATLATSGLYHESYQDTIALTNFTQGERLDLRAVAYPLIGDAAAVVDTNDITDPNLRITGKTTCHMLCDKDATYSSTKIAIVDAIDGDNSSGVVGTEDEARLAPFQQVGEALNSGARLVLVSNKGEPDLVGGWGTTPDTEAYLVVSEDPQDPGAYLYADTANDDNYRRNLLCYENIGIRHTGAGGAGWLDGEGQERQLLFRNVTFDYQVEPNVGFGLSSLGAYFVGCSGMGRVSLGNFASNKVAYSLTGCSETRTDLEFGTGAGWTWVANSSPDGGQGFFSKNDSNPAPEHNNLMVMNNLVTGKIANGGNNSIIRLSEVHRDVAIVGNVFAAKSINASGAMIWLWGDFSAGDAFNIVLAQNTVAGERCNLCYNNADNGIAAYRREIFIQGNAFRSFNIKSDNFAAQPDGARIGNWETEWGINCRDNMYDGSAAQNFVGEYRGIRTTFELNGVTTNFGEMGYTDERSSDTPTGGIGGGDYQPVEGLSVLTTRDYTSTVLKFDMRGQPHIGTIGAIQLGEGPPAIPPGQLLWDLRVGEDLDNTSRYSGSVSYSAVNLSGDTVVASGTAVSDGSNILALQGAGIVTGEQYWTFTRNLPEGEVRGELLTAIEVGE